MLCEYVSFKSPKAKEVEGIQIRDICLCYLQSKVSITIHNTNTIKEWNFGKEEREANLIITIYKLVVVQ